MTQSFYSRSLVCLCFGVLFLSSCTIISAHSGDHHTHPHPEASNPDTSTDSYNLTSVLSCFHSRSPPSSSRASAASISLSHSSPYQPYVILPSFLSETDVSQLLVLSECIRQFAPAYFEDRHFGEGEYSGNLVTFIKDYVPHAMSEWLGYVIAVAEEAARVAGWRPLPSQLTIRCIEVLEYQYPTGQLNWHTDADSVFTLTALLNDNEDFTGGDFLIRRHLGPVNQDAIPTTRISSGYRSGLLFDSEAGHCVEPLQSGVRKVLCIELWAYNESTTMRPSAGGEYQLRLAEEEAKLRIVGREEEESKERLEFERENNSKVDEPNIGENVDLQLELTVEDSWERPYEDLCIWPYGPV